jgi:HD superfamily phosphohydrolase
MENQVIEKELETTALTLKDQATAMVVKDVTGYSAAGELGKSIKELRAKIVDYFQPLKEAAHKAHKAITTKEAEELKPVDEAISILRNTMNAFNEEQKRLERIEQARLQAIADEEARKEREKLLAAAIKAEAAGKMEKAEEKLEQAEMVYSAPVTVAPTVAKTVAVNGGNITQAKETIVGITDMKAFITELVKRNMFPTMLDAKTAALKSWVNANGFDSFPGLSIQKTTGVRF